MGDNTSICSECGANIHGHKCDNCGAFVKLLAYGYNVKKAPTGGYLLEDDGQPIYSFKSTGSKTVGALIDRTGAPREILERELALLASTKAHVEETEEEEEVLVKYRSSLVTPDYLAEQVWDGKTAPVYIVRHFDDDQFKTEVEISLGEADDRGREIIYRPVYNEHLLTGMVTVPQKAVKTNFDELIQETFDYLGQTEFFDPCGKEEQVRLTGLIVMGSWFLDRMIPNTAIPVAGFGRFAPIIPIRGPSETGKNRLANMFRFLSYRPFFVESTHRIPSLFRPLSLWKGTLIMDEADFYKTGPQADITQFLNCRATGTPISRQNPDKVSESQVFESFGITILTQRQHFDDNATESRSVPFYTERTSHKIPTIELDEVVEWGLRLQNKLLYLRLMYWNRFKIDKRYWVSGISDHRLNSALLPTVSLIKFEPKIQGIIEKCVIPIERAKRQIKATSTDGRLVNFLWDKIIDGYYLIHNLHYCVLDRFEIITGDDGEVEDKIPVALTTSKIKESAGIGYKTTRKALNSLNMTPEEAPPRARIGKYSSRPIWFIPEKLEKHLREFVIDYEENSIFEKLGLNVPHVPDVPLPNTRYLLDAYMKNTIQETPIGGLQVEQVEQVEQNDPVVDEEEEKKTTPERPPHVEDATIRPDIEKEKTIVNRLVKAIKMEKQVGELWPQTYLTDRGISQFDAKNIIEGLRLSKLIIQDTEKKHWTVREEEDPR